MPIRFRQDTSYVSKICNISTRQTYMFYFWYYDLAYSKPDIHDCLNNKLTTYIIYRERKIMSKYFFKRRLVFFLSNKPRQRAFQINVVSVRKNDKHCLKCLELWDSGNNYKIYQTIICCIRIIFLVLMSYTSTKLI